MTVLYFAASHANAPQVRRLAETLLQGSATAHVLIHHDSKSDELPNLQGLDRAALYPEQLDIQWGDYSQVRLFLDVTRWALKEYDFTWLVFLSGQDYPIRPISQIEHDLEHANTDVMMTCYPCKTNPNWTPGEGYGRYWFQYFQLPRFQHAYRFPRITALAGRIFQFAIGAQPWLRYRWIPNLLPARLGYKSFHTPFSDSFHCYGGPQWGNFSRKALEYLHQFSDKSPNYGRYFARTLMPDEAFVPSVILNAGRLGLLKLEEDNRRYVHWADEQKDCSPSVITALDLDVVKNSRADFARKFDSRVDVQILDDLDRIVRSNNGKINTV